MGEIGKLIEMPALRAVGLAEMLAKDIDAARFARQPERNGERIGCNHPAFVYGHLSLYPSRVVAMAGEDASEMTPPEEWQGLFKAGAECRDDAEGVIYPAKDELVDSFVSWTRQALERVSAWPDGRFSEPNPAGGRMSEIFPTIGVMANFMFNGHAMMHLGQVSTWRRAMGLGSVM